MPGTLYARPEYLFDESKLLYILKCFSSIVINFNIYLILLDIIISEIKLSSKDYLGLDYVDSIGQVERIRGSEAIYIRN